MTSLPTIDSAITFIEAEIAALDEKRGRLVAAVEGLRLVAGHGESPAPTSPPRPPSPAPQTTKAAGRNKVSVDTALVSKAISILKASGATMRPGELYHRLNLRAVDGRTLQESMLAQNLISVTGKTNQRRMTLT